MTTVGKILVFFNLMFAFVVGTFAVLAYISRTHWADQYGKMEKSYQVVEASEKATRKENDKHVADQKAFNNELAGTGAIDPQLKDKPTEAARVVAATIKKLKDENEELKGKLKTERDTVTKLTKSLDEYKSSNAVAVQDNSRREENEKKLRQDLADTTTQNTKLTEGINYMRDRSVAFQIEAKSLKSRNLQLEDQIHELSRQVVLLKEKGARPATGSASGRNPPPESVEGLIQKVDGDLVKLSIGSDAGLQRGHTMYVFGLNADNVGYRGEIVLREVTPKESVGQLIKGKQVSKIRVGDTVASEIMPRR
jgi:hypothetical protein